MVAATVADMMARGTDVRVLLCVDVEPDERSAFQGLPAWRGTDRLWNELPAWRGALAGNGTGDARLWWFLRMDPQIAILHGEADWCARHYAGQFASARERGDEIGIHVHAWRPRDDGHWTADTGSRDWVRHCLDVSRGAFRKSFGIDARVVRFGDRCLSDDIVHRLARYGFACDVTVEPGFPAAGKMRSDETATGALPDYRRTPLAPYRPSRRDFRRRAAFRPLPLWMVPVSTGCVTCARAHDESRRAPRHAHRPASLNLVLRPDYFRLVLRSLVERERRDLLVIVLRSGDLASAEHVDRARVNVGHLVELGAVRPLRFCGLEGIGVR